jgi:hypothetical protein
MELKSVPETRPYDIPYYVTDAASAAQYWNWRPTESRETTLKNIARWAREHLEQLASFG